MPILCHKQASWTVVSYLRMNFLKYYKMCSPLSETRCIGIYTVDESTVIQIINCHIMLIEYIVNGIWILKTSWLHYIEIFPSICVYFFSFHDILHIVIQFHVARVIITNYVSIAYFLFSFFAVYTRNKCEATLPGEMPFTCKKYRKLCSELKLWDHLWHIYKYKQNDMFEYIWLRSLFIH